jgi:hypothetical protein
MLDGTPEDRREIDDLVRRFFAAFTNEGGVTPDVAGIESLFVPQAIIVKAIGDNPEIYSLQSFIEPRLRILTDGTLTDFREEETASRTEVFGNVAQRYSRYRKSGVMSGARTEGKGAKMLQFVRTDAGWRISALAWDDES